MTSNEKKQAKKINYQREADNQRWGSRSRKRKKIKEEEEDQGRMQILDEEDKEK